MGLSALFGVLFYIISASVTSLAAQLGTYAGNLNERLVDIQSLLEQYGITVPNLAPAGSRNVLDNSTLLQTIRVFLGGLAGFFSDSFLILMTTLFFIAEGPMMMKRMRRSASGDHLLVQRLTQFGQGVVRQFGLRGIVNAVTGVGGQHHSAAAGGGFLPFCGAF